MKKYIHYILYAIQWILYRWGRKPEKLYFETSAFNYLLDIYDSEQFIATRPLQALLRRKMLLSPITLWEIMLATDDTHSDSLIYFAQNLFDKKMLASPSEIIVRYFTKAYPKNIINYNIYTKLEIGKIWAKMTKDSSITLIYDKDKLREKTQLLWNLSTNLNNIIKYPRSEISDEWTRNVAHIVNTFYECSRDDGFFTINTSSNYNLERLYKIAILFVLVFFVLGLDFERDTIENYWNNIGISDPMERMKYVFETYHELFKRGPILELSVMAYHQLELNDRSRGLLFDCYHTIYAPHVNQIITNDNNFARLSELETHYARKLTHVSDMHFTVAPFIDAP
jgi:hypothetical protein